VEVDLLVAEPEGEAALTERLEPHPEDARVEVDAAVAAARRQDQVVEALDHGGVPWRAASRLTWD
jgi:hypothetical protein